MGPEMPGPLAFFTVASQEDAMATHKNHKKAKMPMKGKAKSMPMTPAEMKKAHKRMMK